MNFLCIMSPMKCLRCYHLFLDTQGLWKKCCRLSPLMLLQCNQLWLFLQVGVYPVLQGVGLGSVRRCFKQRFLQCTNCFLMECSNKCWRNLQPSCDVDVTEWNVAQPHVANQSWTRQSAVNKIAAARWNVRQIMKRILQRTAGKMWTLDHRLWLQLPSQMCRLLTAPIPPTTQTIVVAPTTIATLTRSFSNLWRTC